jgi:RimJ/RimL family protein N-acetyltransferase
MPTSLSFRRLNSRSQADRDEWREVFRNTPSFTYATAGQTPTEADADRMFKTVPSGAPKLDLFLYSIYADEALCGIAYLAKDFPRAGEANLVLLVLAESFHGRWLGVRAVKWLAASAKAMGCSKLTGVVDSANERSAMFWKRLGFIEERRTAMPELVGQAIVGYLPL